MRRQEAPQDAWGSEDEEVQLAPGSAQRWAPVPKQPSTPTVPAARRAARLSAVAAAAAAQPTARMRQPPPGGGRGAGPPSLHAICLGVLAEHLDELIECGEDVLPLLPAPAKASLLAVARLRRLLSDAALALLADCEHTILDLRGCGDLVSDAGVRAALRGMPHLRLADLSSCPVGPVTLRALGEACPAVEVLRLGSAATDQGAGRALQDILPVLPAERRQAPAAESWDALLVADEPAALAAAVAPGRLMQLRCLHWPSVPFKVEQYCRTACPALALNPSAEDVARRRLPPACDPAAQLDAPLLAEVAGAARWEARPAEAPRPAVVHIAEKFKQAYIDRERRIKARQERQWQQQRRREERERSAADRLIEQWEGQL